MFVLYQDDILPDVRCQACSSWALLKYNLIKVTISAEIPHTSQNSWSRLLPHRRYIATTNSEME